MITIFRVEIEIDKFFTFLIAFINNLLNFFLDCENIDRAQHCVGCFTSSRLLMDCSFFWLGTRSLLLQLFLEELDLLLPSE